MEEFEKQEAVVLRRIFQVKIIKIAAHTETESGKFSPFSCIYLILLWKGS